jgi:triphosphoribosyl-dephospho-CoA synthase
MTVDIASAAQLACLLEASAPKPGNVSPGRHFADVRYEHFLASAAAIGAPLSSAGDRPVGETILRAAQATSTWTRSNTNLGIVLLLAPLARAASALRAAPGQLDTNQPEARVPPAEALRATLHDVLHRTTVEDAHHVFAAIRLASPGGLGNAPDQDVADEPTVTLLAAMRLAADHDGIAREYATTFATTFEVALPALVRARADGLSWDDVVVDTFMTVLAGQPDTHIARRGGPELAIDIAQRAAEVQRAGGVRSEEGRRALGYFDHSLRDPRNVGNPGTTADLTAAAIFVALLQGAWNLPVDTVQ